MPTGSGFIMTWLLSVLGSSDLTGVVVSICSDNDAGVRGSHPFVFPTSDGLFFACSGALYGLGNLITGVISVSSMDAYIYGAVVLKSRATREMGDIVDPVVVNRSDMGVAVGRRRPIRAV